MIKSRPSDFTIFHYSSFQIKIAHSDFTIFLFIIYYSPNYKIPARDIFQFFIIVLPIKSRISNFIIKTDTLQLILHFIYYIYPFKN